MRHTILRPLLPTLLLLTVPVMSGVAQDKELAPPPGGVTRFRVDLLASVLGSDEKDVANWTLMLEATHAEVAGIREEMSILKERIMELEANYWDEFRAGLGSETQRERFDRMRSDGVLDLEMPHELIPCISARYAQEAERSGSTGAPMPDGAKAPGKPKGERRTGTQPKGVPTEVLQDR